MREMTPETMSTSPLEKSLHHFALAGSLLGVPLGETGQLRDQQPLTWTMTSTTTADDTMELWDRLMCHPENPAQIFSFFLKLEKKANAAVCTTLGVGL